MKYIFIMLTTAVLFLSACSDEGSTEKAELTAEQRADNPLLKMQDDTTKKAEDAVNAALKKQQEALDKIGQ